MRAVDGDRDERRGHLVVLCGLPGAGKTTLARRLVAESGGVRFEPDAWLQALGVSLWDAQTRSRIEDLQWSMARELLALGGTVVIEWGTWVRTERERLRAEAATLGATTELVYLDAPDEQLWERIRVRQHEQPPMTREDLSAWRRLLEPPDAAERGRFDVAR